MSSRAIASSKLRRVNKKELDTKPQSIPASVPKPITITDAMILLEKKIMEHDHMIKDMSSSQKQKEEEEATLQMSLQDKQQYNMILKDVSDKLTTRMALKNESLASLEKKINTKLSEVTRKLDSYKMHKDLEEKLSTMEKNIDTMKKRLDDNTTTHLNNDVKDIRTQIYQMRKSIAVLTRTQEVEQIIEKESTEIPVDERAQAEIMQLKLKVRYLLEQVEALNETSKEIPDQTVIHVESDEIRAKMKNMMYEISRLKTQFIDIKDKSANSPSNGVPPVPQNDTFSKEILPSDIEQLKKQYSVIQKQNAYLMQKFK